MSTAIRLAEPADANAITALLHELGYRVTVDNVHKSLKATSDSDPIFVATSTGTVVGMLSLHIARWIQLVQPIARIPAMIVSGKFQRRGIGRQLVEHAIAYARSHGCGSIELTSANERDDAHAFYRDMGFEQTSLRFKRPL